MLDFTKRIFDFSQFFISQDAKYIFVADCFSADYEGGAELTTDAIISYTDQKNVTRLHAKDVTNDLVLKYADKYWVFGNVTQLNPSIYQSVIQNLKYSIIEYDYKFCKYRSPDKHQADTKSNCDCADSVHGKAVETFFSYAKSVFWMSEAQKNVYLTRFPKLGSATDHHVLSSIFSEDHLTTIKKLKSETVSKSDSWIILGSNSWVKGFEASKKKCEELNLQYEIVWNLPYKECLKKIASSKGLVYLPEGDDTCPRLVIEAKMLGSELILNQHVQNEPEEWFRLGTIESISEYVKTQGTGFWKTIQASRDKKVTLGGYTTVLNCLKNEYPWKQSISSLLGFCDEVVVVDGGSNDGTWEELQNIAKLYQNLKIFQVPRDWNHKRSAVFDGEQKAVAREKCVSDFLWQQDADEIVHEQDYEKIKALVASFPKNVELLALPVIEYWGSDKKVRVDVNPWKWRLSKNTKTITHGIPAAHRRYDEEGQLYSAGSDGCDYIYKGTFEQVNFATFYTPQIESVRNAALAGNQEAIAGYSQWMNMIASQVPGVYHYSWYNIERKIKTYKTFWSRHWESMFNKKQEDTPENNMFFDKCWADVSDSEIHELAQKMSDNMGGWIFHAKIDFSKPTPWVVLQSKQQPASMVM